VLILTTRRRCTIKLRYSKTYNFVGNTGSSCLRVPSIMPIKRSAVKRSARQWTHGVDPLPHRAVRRISYWILQFAEHWNCYCVASNISHEYQFKGVISKTNFITVSVCLPLMWRPSVCSMSEMWLRSADAALIVALWVFWIVAFRCSIWSLQMNATS
jgi:hypothetical protein